MSTNLCPVCGACPCYHLCPNSPHYYSAEQERAADPFYGEDDVRERYAREVIGLDDERDFEPAPGVEPWPGPAGPYPAVTDEPLPF